MKTRRYTEAEIIVGQRRVEDCVPVAGGVPRARLMTRSSASGGGGASHSISLRHLGLA
jgi:hypothetical protein